VNFIKIAPLLRVGSIQVKNVGLWEVPLPPVRFQKFFVQDVFSSIHTSCVNFIKIAALSRVGFIQIENTGLWGVPLPPVRFRPFAIPAESSSKHTFWLLFHQNRLRFTQVIVLTRNWHRGQSTGYAEKWNAKYRYLRVTHNKKSSILPNFSIFFLNYYPIHSSR